MSHPPPGLDQPPRWRRALLLVCAALAAGLPAPAWSAPVAAAPAEVADGGAQFDALLLLAEEAPARARAALLNDVGPMGASGSAAQRRERALLRAWVALRSGPPQPDAAAAAPVPALALPALQAELARAGAAVSTRLAEADAALMQALLADRDGLPAVELLAHQALAAYDEHCSSMLPLQADCELRGRWQARWLLAQQARFQLASGAAQEHAQAGLELALAGHDRRRQAWSTCQLAVVAAASGQGAAAATLLERARSLIGPDADLTLQQRLAEAEARVAWAQGDTLKAGQALQRLLTLAQRGESARQRAAALANLADHAAKTGAPRKALRAAEQGLALLGNAPSDALRSVLLNNAMLARIALGRVDEARGDFEVLQAAWSASGNTGRQVESLREYGDALAAANDLNGALEMHHRERRLTDTLMAANRDAALTELRKRFDREAQQRQILLLERGNALTATALANQALDQRLWAAAGGVLALAGLLLMLLVHRVRETRRRLEHHQAHLRVQSERDALTGVASRRHAQTLLRSAAASAPGADGALLMIDIDHFKQINDRHGHAAGDRVLAETARRIAAVVRPQDLVARWGGEEFLVHAPGLAVADGEALARRLLQAVAGAPVAVDGRDTLRVTASIGHAVFPLAPLHPQAGLEQAINLVDMALYVAKSQGRHRAVGIRACHAGSPEALRVVESDFERAWQDGRVSLHSDAGPAPALEAAHTVAAVPAVAAASASSASSATEASHAA